MLDSIHEILPIRTPRAGTQLFIWAGVHNRVETGTVSREFDQRARAASINHRENNLLAVRRNAGCPNVAGSRKQFARVRAVFVRNVQVSFYYQEDSTVGKEVCTLHLGIAEAARLSRWEGN